MRKFLSLLFLVLVLGGVSCREQDPVKQVISYRNKYIVKSLGFNLVRDENGDPAYLNVEFAIENKNSKPVLKYLTLIVKRYDVRDNVVGENTIVVDVSDIGGYKLKRFIRKIPNKIRGIRAISVAKAPVDTTKRDFLKYKEFQGLSLTK